MSITLRRLIVGTALAATAGTLLAQASGLTRTVVGRADVSVPGREAVVEKGKPLATPAP
jgi:ABC-type nitrate/sulfonate/bicarbonate transport system permease component